MAQLALGNVRRRNGARALFVTAFTAALAICSLLGWEPPAGALPMVGSAAGATAPGGPGPGAHRSLSKVAQLRQEAETVAHRIQVEGIVMAKLDEKADAGAIARAQTAQRLKLSQASALRQGRRLAKAKTLVVEAAVAAYTNWGASPDSSTQQSSQALVTDGYAQVAVKYEQTVVARYGAELSRDRAVVVKLHTQRTALARASRQLVVDRQGATQQENRLQATLAKLKGKLGQAVRAAELRQERAQQLREEALWASRSKRAATVAAGAAEPGTTVPPSTLGTVQTTLPATGPGAAGTDAPVLSTTTVPTTVAPAVSTTPATSTTSTTSTTLAPTTTSALTTTTAGDVTTTATTTPDGTATSSTVPGAGGSTGAGMTTTSGAAAGSGYGQGASSTTAPPPGSSTTPGEDPPGGTATTTTAPPTDSSTTTLPTTTVPPVAPGGGTGSPAPGSQVAIAFAESQIGKPYQWGGAGPDSYDCSGLVMVSWGKAGVSLPHSAQDQYDLTTRIAIPDLLPGDLVFFGTPTDVYHVGLYIGDGKMVDAPETGQDVQIQTIFGLNLLAGGRVK